MSRITGFVAARLYMMQARAREFLADEEGISTLEIVLIVVVLLALVIIFKSKLTQLVNSVFTNISEKKDAIVS